MLLTDLAAAVAKSGLPVVEVSGWQTRGHGHLTSLEAVICHHTAGPRTGDYPSLRIVRDGRGRPNPVDGPLAQLGLGRDGTVYVIAAGVAYHAGATKAVWMNNWHAIGIEAEATGVDPWPEAQMDAYARLCRALCDHYKIPVTRVLGHKEVCEPTGRKVDPNFDMHEFRKRITNLEDSMPLNDADLARIREIVKDEVESATKPIHERIKRVRIGLAAWIRKTGKASRERDKALATELEVLAQSLERED